MRTERIDLIEEYIQKRSVSLDTLCMEFSVSKNTIRRDIDTLLKRGSHFAEEKDAICKAASVFVSEHNVIYIDTGTTCLNLTNYPPEYIPITANFVH